jgi:hypothetical protein
VALTAVAVAILTAAAWPVGAALLSAFAWDELRRFERMSLELTAGYGAVALILSAALLLGAFRLAVPLLVIAASAGAFVVRAVANRSPRAPQSPSRYEPASRVARAVGLMIGGCAVLACTGALAPVTDHDALSYVVPIANHIATEGTLRVWTDQAPSMWPQAHTVLLAFIVRAGGDRLAALSAIEWLIAIGAVSALARRACRREDHVPLVLALTIAAPAAAFQVAAAKEDMLLLAATAAALFCLAGPLTVAEAAAAGLFAGIAAGVKYPGLGVAIAVLAWIAIASRGRLGATSAAVGSAIAAGGIWYALNSWRFGNPVAPFLLGADGTPLDANAVRAAMDNYGGGRGLLNFVVTPLRVFLDQELYGGRAALFHPLVYAGLAALLTPNLRRRNVPFFFTAAVLYVGWYLSLQQARLLLPAAMALAPAAAEVLAPPMRRSRAITAGVAASLLIPLLLAPAVGLVRAARYFEEPETYLVRETEHYTGVVWANTHLDRSKHRVLSMFGVVGYFTVPAIGLDPLHQLEFNQADIADHDRLLAACRRRRVTHIFTARHDLADVESQLRLVFEDAHSRLGDARFFRSPPIDATAIFEILPASLQPPDALRLASASAAYVERR